uniref:Alfin N-terminal domain-containing protein n=1 Tax=Mantoniella antarctica TaxID=81844 RepID=A0A7S0S7D0_9CHLO
MEAPRTVEDVFDNFSNRRAGLIKALTGAVDDFYEQCDPDKENLCLYGNPDGTWEVQLPAEEVPPELPEPALGINFARDGMQRKDWLALVAVHSDAWLMAVAFYYGAKFDGKERERLFKSINSLPTVYETLSGKAAVKVKATSKKAVAAVVPEGQPPAKKARVEDAHPAPSAAGLRKPSPGFILRADGSLVALNNAHIELFWPDDQLWYRAEVVSLNSRARSAKVLYATGDVETLSIDEIASEGHLNVCT